MYLSNTAINHSTWLPTAQRHCKLDEKGAMCDWLILLHYAPFFLAMAFSSSPPPLSSTPQPLGPAGAANPLLIDACGTGGMLGRAGSEHGAVEMYEGWCWVADKLPDFIKVMLTSAGQKQSIVIANPPFYSRRCCCCCCYSSKAWGRWQ